MSSRTIHERILIDGLNTRGALPEEYVEHRNYSDVYTFDDALAYLDVHYNVEGRPAYYADDGKAHAATHWQAFVNPRWVPEAAGEPPAGKDDAVWSMATERYSPVGPRDAWDPLFAALDDGEYDVFGEIRLTRDGGDQELDLFIPEITVDHGDFEQTLGIASGNDYFGERRVFAEPIALDLHGDLRESGLHVMRGLPGGRRRKHTGAATGDVKPWWAAIIDTCEQVSEKLYGIVADAMNYQVDFSALPCTIEEFYEHMGFPNGHGSPIAEQARQRAMKTVTGCYTAFHLYRGVMQALEENYASRNAGAFTTHMATANELLFAPATAEAGVINTIRDELDEEQSRLARGEDGELGPAEIEEAEAMLDDRHETIADGVETFKSYRERLETMLEEAEEADDEEAEAEEVEV